MLHKATDALFEECAEEVLAEPSSPVQEQLLSTEFIHADIIPPSVEVPEVVTVEQHEQSVEEEAFIADISIPTDPNAHYVQDIDDVQLADPTSPSALQIATDLGKGKASAASRSLADDT